MASGLQNAFAALANLDDDGERVENQKAVRDRAPGGGQKKRVGAATGAGAKKHGGYDKRSQGGRGQGRSPKKGGAGKGNWGTEMDGQFDAEDTPKNEQEEANANAEGGGEAAVEEEPEDVTVGYDEWLEENGGGSDQIAFDAATSRRGGDYKPEGQETLDDLDWMTGGQITGKKKDKRKNREKRKKRVIKGNFRVQSENDRRGRGGRGRSRGGYRGRGGGRGRGRGRGGGGRGGGGRGGGRGGDRGRGGRGGGRGRGNFRGGRGGRGGGRGRGNFRGGRGGNQRQGLQIDNQEQFPTLG